MLLIAAASTIAGCASMPLADSKSAENAGAYQDTDGSIGDIRSNANVCHVVRDALLDPGRISVNVFSLFGLPVVFFRDANCPL
jgi:hypothetical protein